MKLVELEEWFKDLRDIILDLNICVNNGIRISTNEYENEDKVKQSGFFYHTQFQQAFIIAIQLCKILHNNPNQKRNIHKLFKDLESGIHDELLLEKLNRTSSNQKTIKDELLTEIKVIQKTIENRQDLIEEVVEVRDKAYAHIDPTRKAIGPSLLQYQELIDLCSSIYNSLSSKIFGSPVSKFKHTVDWNIDPVLLRASKAYTHMINQRKRKK